MNYKHLVRLCECRCSLELRHKKSLSVFCISEDKSLLNLELIETLARIVILHTEQVVQHILKRILKSI